MLNHVNIFFTQTFFGQTSDLPKNAATIVKLPNMLSVQKNLFFDWLFLDTIANLATNQDATLYCGSLYLYTFARFV